MSKVLRITMNDGSKWDIPAEIIAENRARYYGSKPGESYADEYAFTLSDDYEIEDWAANNMNWSDVKDRATMSSPSTVDYQEGWLNGDREVLTP